MATLSNAGFNLLKGFEGFRNKPYHLKGEKYYTVGLGHYGPDVDPNRVYTDEECMAFFAQDKLKFEADVNKVWHSPMTQQMFDALFSMAYNHGNVSRTVLNNACAGTGWQNVTKVSSIWKNLYTVGGLLSTRRAKEVAYFYSNTDTGGTYTADTTALDSYVYESTTGSGGYAAGEQANTYTTYDSIYAGASLNTNLTASLVMDSSNASLDTQHTRIYKYSDPSILVDELSMALDEGTMKSSTANNSSTNNTTNA